MKAYRVTVNLKLGLILFAVIIAVSSLWYTKDLVSRLRQRETSIVELWARALEQVPKAAQEGVSNPYQKEFRELDSLFRRGQIRDPEGTGVSLDRVEAYRRSLAWAESMPPASDLTFILDAFLEPNVFDIPAILVDSADGNPAIWRNVPVSHESFAGLTEEERLELTRELNELRLEMDAVHTPVPIEVSFPAKSGQPAFRLSQQMHYGESSIVQALRWYPYIQLAFVGLFVLVGYFGFSYVRRSEQSNLWVGMAREAAHQLGTPISSLMGWTEYLRLQDNLSESQSEAYDEIERDTQRLSRVAGRFSDIGSLPKLQVRPIEPVLDGVTNYMRARLPKSGKMIRLSTEISPDIKAPLNADLFEWVVENLLKNAIDAIESDRGNIRISASMENGSVVIDVTDSGKGIDRRHWKNVFRPGYSTKKRGWGLGLSLAKRIVEDYHGGSLVLYQSKPGLGTTFRVQIPGAVLSA
jgi:Histidine kinase-, DNA gyrase B-, and HSP90-like ATPase/His Kinase A (phospho-acceptor) domain